MLALYCPRLHDGIMFPLCILCKDMDFDIRDLINVIYVILF